MTPRDAIRAGVGVAVIGTAALAGVTVFAAVAVAERVAHGWRHLFGPSPTGREVTADPNDPLIFSGFGATRWKLRHEDEWHEGTPPRREQCPVCKGTGWLPVDALMPGARYWCETCDGSGRWTPTHADREWLKSIGLDQ